MSPTMAKTLSGGAAISVERVTTASRREQEGAADDDDGDGGDQIENPFQESHHGCYPHGCDVYLPLRKDFSAARLRQAVKRLMSRA